jgi:hypothetical protein
LTSIDVSTGNVRWRHPLPYPAAGGVLITATGLAFTSDVGGNLYAFDAATGQQYWTDFTGSNVVAPFSAYSIDGIEYLAVVVGEAGNQQTPNLPTSQGSRVLSYRLGSGADLQGTSAPALTGPGFGRSHLSASQLRDVVTQRMPLTSPGSLNPRDYASVMAFLLSYDCVKPAGDGQQPFPTGALPVLPQATVGGTTCASR